MASKASNESAARTAAATTAPRSARPIFTVRDLSFSYPCRHGDPRGGRRIFHGLDLTLSEGIVTTLIGANGSGKSTLFNLMTKNLVPTGGSVHLRGGDVAQLRLRDFARLVAIVHQRNTAPADLSVEKVVGYGRYAHHDLARVAATEEDDRMVAWALATCGLSDLAQSPVSALSGGQTQRVWIAMALAQGTRVLLLDEPTTYLDIRYQLDILRLVRRLNEEFGMTVVMVLHDINQAIHYSDEIVALAGGRVVAQGDPRRVVTGELLRRVYDVDLRVAEVDGEPFVVPV